MAGNNGNKTTHALTNETRPLKLTPTNDLHLNFDAGVIREPDAPRHCNEHKTSSMAKRGTSDHDKILKDLGQFQITRDQAQFSELEESVLAAYDELEELRLERVLLETSIQTPRGTGSCLSVLAALKS